MSKVKRGKESLVDMDAELGDFDPDQPLGPQLTQMEARKKFIIRRLDEIGGYRPKVVQHSDEKKKTHEDFLLDEVRWLAKDFEEERKRHIGFAKKLSKAVIVHFKTLDTKGLKEVKDQESSLRKTSSKISKEVKKFWLKINQIVAYKQKLEADSARQKAMDKHLFYLVKQTERYTELMAENMRAGGQTQDQEPKVESSSESDSSPSASSSQAASSSEVASSSDADSVVESDDNSENMQDDGDDYSQFETAPISRQKRKGSNASVADSPKVPKKISKLSSKHVQIEADSSAISETKSSPQADSEEPLDDDDYEMSSGVDDETTLLQEEQLGQEVDPNEELRALQEDKNMSVAELLAMYRSRRDSDDLSEDGENSSEDMEKHISDRGKSVTSTVYDNVDDHESPDEYKADEESVTDDETTLIEEEEWEKAQSTANGQKEPDGGDDEIKMLEAEKDLPIEELLKRIYGGTEEGLDVDGEPIAQSESESQPDSEYQASEDLDDETTLLQEEKLEAEMTAEEEMRLLQNDMDLPVEELKRMYGAAEEKEHSDEKVRVAEEGRGETWNDAVKRLEEVDEAARTVQVERPYLLTPKVRLREYQHMGLNWLVSLHERRLNGILADEMGLGKTLQTISLLAYLACRKGIWGPHLIVVPTSCIVNWEVEFKKWCPAFKIMTYYGPARERKIKRQGWSKLNQFHVCVTSYQLVVQDAIVFRRKRWYYMVLDEAHNIKNFKSQRWQTLLNFNTQRRLLLTGTPLQNNLMELWSLMHFLMPHLFRSRKEFGYWFSNPLNHMVEGTRGVNTDLIKRLHTIMRPFIIRRLKKDVEKQLPGKFEHFVKCHLSRRQLFLYEEFMARSSTRAALSGNNFMGMMNILMQLRKVCNHPDLFEPRPIVSSFYMHPGVTYQCPSLAARASEYGPMEIIADTYIHLWETQTDALELQRICELQARKEQLLQVVVDDVHLSPPTTRLGSGLYAAIMELRAHLCAQKNARRLSMATRNARICGDMPARFGSMQRLVSALSMEPTVIQKVFEIDKHPERGRDIPPSLVKMILTVDQRAAMCSEMIQDFVFVIPRVKVATLEVISSTPNAFSMRSWRQVESHVLPLLKAHLDPFYKAALRQKIYFPDRKLVQFDSGKLQVLNNLLRTLKREGHKCLIFTQMSKMLDILEVFLNLHGHTYVRLDGSTNVEKRQRLMDRFNSDPKLFCFVLSTRSGGLGINLTGADCVIFYDSDWNPAMDAQAQDRAHRIGQTRDVHIYRLICEKTVEENILTKAQQKRHLDFLVMTEGNFTAESLYSQDNLKELLITGMESKVYAEGVQKVPTLCSGEAVGDVEATMAMLEDEDDVAALHGAKKEAIDEQQEFDDKATVEVGEIDDIEDGIRTEEKSPAKELEVEGDSKQLEEEMANMQTRIGTDLHGLLDTLKKVERLSIRFKEEVEQYKSLFFISEEQRRAEMEEADEEWDVAEIEMEKQLEEARALSEGVLLAAHVSDSEVANHKALYLRERKEKENKRNRRKLTGEAWIPLWTEEGVMFYENQDTGERMLETPPQWIERDTYTRAVERGYTGIPLRLLQQIYQYLEPFQRLRCECVCARWREAAGDGQFFKRVWPVESGARERKNRLKPTEYACLFDALSESARGDTFVLDSGHHWEHSLHVHTDIRIVGDARDPSRVVLELTGQLYVESGCACVLEGLTLRRPKRVQDGAAVMVRGGRLMMCSCVVNNDGGCGAGVRCDDANVCMFGVVITQCTGSGLLLWGGEAKLAHSQLTENGGSGIVCIDACMSLEDCTVARNAREGVTLLGSSVLYRDHCDLRKNKRGSVHCDSRCVVYGDSSKDLVDAGDFSLCTLSQRLDNTNTNTQTAMNTLTNPKAEEQSEDDEDILQRILEAPHEIAQGQAKTELMRNSSGLEFAADLQAQFMRSTRTRASESPAPTSIVEQSLQGTLEGRKRVRSSVDN